MAVKVLVRGCGVTVCDHVTSYRLKSRDSPLAKEHNWKVEHYQVYISYQGSNLFYLPWWQQLNLFEDVNICVVDEISLPEVISSASYLINIIFTFRTFKGLRCYQNTNSCQTDIF